MTDAAPTPRRTITLRSPSGKPVLTLSVLPAVAAAAAALALAPRLTATVALAALLRKMTLSIDGASRPEPRPAA